jgi:NAD(P)-dependent dehydrogenase (short-subunit alcohol dehydrogenase family)
MDLELIDNVAVVTGASKGIGLAVVRELAAEGALVVAGARSTETFDDLDGVSGYAVDLLEPDGPAPSSPTRSSCTAGSTCSSTTSGACIRASTAS